MCGWESQILGKDRLKSRVKSGKLSFSKKFFQFCSRRIAVPLLHIFDPNYPSFIEIVPENVKKKLICTFPILNFGVDPKFDYTLYLYIIKVGLCKAWLFFCKSYRRNTFGGWARASPPPPPPLAKEGLKPPNEMG